MLVPFRVLCVYTYLHTVYTILCKLDDVFEMRSDEHKITVYLDVVAEVRCYKLTSSNIYLFYRYLLCDGDHSVFHNK